MNKKNIYTNHFTNEKENTYTPTAFKDIRHAFGLKELSYKTKDEKNWRSNVKNFARVTHVSFAVRLVNGFLTQILWYARTHDVRDIKSNPRMARLLPLFRPILN